MMFSLQKNEKDARVTFEMFLPMLQDVSSKPIRDTVDDFVEGLKHFDKVIYIYCVLLSSKVPIKFILCRRGTVSSPPWSSATCSLGLGRR